MVRRLLGKEVLCVSGRRSFVVEECCFDRSQFSHWVNLFEMNQKYADVMTLKEALALIAKLRWKATPKRAAL